MMNFHPRISNLWITRGYAILYLEGLSKCFLLQAVDRLFTPLKEYSPTTAHNQNQCRYGESPVESSELFSIFQPRFDRSSFSNSFVLIYASGEILPLSSCKNMHQPRSLGSVPKGGFDIWISLPERIIQLIYCFM